VGSNRRRLITLAVIGLLIAPAVADRDGFPLATYPMYARARADVVSLPTATGVTAADGRQRLSLDVIGRSDDPLIVAALLRDGLAGNDEQRQDLCRQIADRAAAAGLNIEQVELATETHDVVERVSGRQSLVERQIHATCPVEQ
jgi:hypothetical protein